MSPANDAATTAAAVAQVAHGAVTAAAGAALTLTPFARNLSWVATVANICMLSSPLQLVHRFVRHQMDPIDDAGDLTMADAGGKHQPTLMMVNGVSIIPLLANVCCCTGWVIYALLTGLSAVLVGNGLGLASAVVGTVLYVYVYATQLGQVRAQLGTLSPAGGMGGITAHTSSNTPVMRAYHHAVAGQRQMQTQLAIAVTVCVLLLWGYLELGAAALPLIRVFCGCATVAMFAAPLAVIRKVIAGLAIPSAVFTWPNTLATLGNCILWLLFGLLISDAAVGLPNVVGIVVSLSQASLLMRDRRHVVIGVR